MYCLCILPCPVCHLLYQMTATHWLAHLCACDVAVTILGREPPSACHLMRYPFLSCWTLSSKVSWRAGTHREALNHTFWHHCGRLPYVCVSSLSLQKLWLPVCLPWKFCRKTCPRQVPAASLSGVSSWLVVKHSEKQGRLQWILFVMEGMMGYTYLGTSLPPRLLTSQFPEGYRKWVEIKVRAGTF